MRCDHPLAHPPIHPSMLASMDSALPTHPPTPTLTQHTCPGTGVHALYHRGNEQACKSARGPGFPAGPTRCRGRGVAARNRHALHCRAAPHTHTHAYARTHTRTHTHTHTQVASLPDVDQLRRRQARLICRVEAACKLAQDSLSLLVSLSLSRYIHKC